MAGLDPAIQQASVCEPKNLDGRLKGGHDGWKISGIVDLVEELGT